MVTNGDDLKGYNIVLSKTLHNQLATAAASPDYESISDAARKLLTMAFQVKALQAEMQDPTKRAELMEKFKWFNDAEQMAQTFEGMTTDQLQAVICLADGEKQKKFKQLILDVALHG